MLDACPVAHQAADKRIKCEKLSDIGRLVDHAAIHVSRQQRRERRQENSSRSLILCATV
jgi:hypothetical protein